jgi:membrane-anchored protein YejM (alkaline phosphatase superfamily)
MNTNFLISILAFTILTLLWLGFGFALLFHREILDRTWQTFRSWNILFKSLAVLLLLPVIFGLWIWEQHWPAWLRLLIVIGLAWMTEYTFFPHFLFG